MEEKMTGGTCTCGRRRGETAINVFRFVFEEGAVMVEKWVLRF
jgi:hypothetical protein